MCLILERIRQCILKNRLNNLHNLPNSDCFVVFYKHVLNPDRRTFTRNVEFVTMQ